MEKYTKPEMEVVKYNESEVICASGDSCTSYIDSCGGILSYGGGGSVTPR